MTVWYTDDDTAANLTGFNAEAPQEEYTINAASGHSTVNIEAEAASEAAVVTINWNIGTQTSQAPAEDPSRAAARSSVPLPSSEGADLEITVTVSSGTAESDVMQYKIAVRAPATNAPPPIDTSLTTLKVTFAAGADTTTNLLTNFLPEVTTGYTIPFYEVADAERALTVTAVPTDSTAAVTVSPSSVAVPATGGANLAVTVTVKKGVAQTTYSISIIPPQNPELESDRALSALTLLYGDSSNVLDGAFNAATTNYDITVPNGKTQVRLTAATPASSKAAVVIKYGGTATFGAPDDTDYTVGNPINLPAKGDTILVIKIRVTAENSQHQTYRITFSNPTQVFTWQGTVTLEGNAASTYTVKSVEVKTTNGMHFSSGNVSTEANNWSVQISETYATAANPPDIFTVILQTSAQKIYRTAFLTTDLGGAEPAVDIALTVEDAAAAGIALEVHDPLDLATMLPTENYYLADDIDLTELDGAWNGPDNYGETFDGNGHTIRLQLSNTTGPVGLFDSLASNAVIKNFTVEVSTSEALKDSLTIDYLYFGSVIGMVSSGTTNLKIQNIKATGRLEFFRHSGDKWITIGGFIGGINEANTSSYSQDHIYIGGFLGKQWRADHALTIENSAALNPRVVARVAANHTSYAHYGRMLSVIPNGHTVTLTNNHGLDAMPIGVVTTADDAPATTIDGADAAANNKEGENQTEATLHTAAFWTDTAGWSTSIWDFTDILTAWPTLK